MPSPPNSVLSALPPLPSRRRAEVEAEDGAMLLTPVAVSRERHIKTAGFSPRCTYDIARACFRTSHGGRAQDCVGRRNGRGQRPLAARFQRR